MSEVRESDLAPLIRVADRLFADRSLLGAGHRPVAGRAGRGMEFLDHQDYTPGEDLRRIDWRASARSRVPQLRRYHDEKATDWVICVDHSASMGTSAGSKWRLATQLAICLAYLLMHMGNRVAVQLLCDRVDRAAPFGRGHHHHARIVRLFHDNPPQSGRGCNLAGSAFSFPPLAPVVFISDFLAPDGMWPGLARLLATGRTVQALQITDSWDVRLNDNAGPRELCDVESGETLAVSEPGRAAIAAAATLAELTATLAANCRTHGIVHTLCPTDTGWRAAMLDHFRALQHA